MDLKRNKDRLKKLKSIEKAISYRFRNKSLLNQALTHKSYANERSQSCSGDNERLEFLGDSVLGIVISNVLYNDYPDKDEGVLTKYKSQLVSGTTLGRIAKELRFGEYLLLGKGEEASGGKKHASNLLCALEALIGAIYLDGDLKSAARFIKRIYDPELLLVKEGKGTRDYKSVLQQIALRRFKTIPSYRIISEIGPDHKKHFIVEAVMTGKRFGIGSGPNKKTAEQAAAKEAISAIEAAGDSF
ncbi:MAG: ribonuclease III [Candidatus Omnitrophica bacterium]|nr:ribonuclease III [Candidatus Omnitrophota bacterium]MBU4149653.1 ribonuclease III [Candidatus Omnitrophota bacterium]